MSRLLSSRRFSGIFRGAEGMRLPFGRSRAGRATKSKATYLQQLVTALQEIQSSEIDERCEARLSDILGKVTLDELGMGHYASAAAQACMPDSSVKSSMFSRLFRRTRPAPKMTYIPICETSEFSIAVFCFPKGSHLPMHDHPNMTVFSKPLYGLMKVQGYDWLDGLPSRESNEPKPVSLTVDEVLDGESAPVILRPTSGGNVHTFTALEHSAILDVLCPPYLDFQDCTYYKLDMEAPAGTTRLMRTDDPQVPDMIEDKYQGLRLDVERPLRSQRTP